jgi:hypothetical protein
MRVDLGPAPNQRTLLILYSIQVKEPTPEAEIESDEIYRSIPFIHIS